MSAAKRFMRAKPMYVEIGLLRSRSDFGTIYADNFP